jgi:predicted lysophospholipase L1 biosynthesis ABC-type transport system permease subunit
MKGLVSLLVLSARLAARDWRAGELRVLVAALVIAIAAVTSVGFFSDRVRLALLEQANALLGADLVVVSDRALGPEVMQEAARLGLSQASVLRFPSMVVLGDRAQLSEVRAVGEGYPVKGEIALSPRHLEPPVATRGVPERGTVWVDPALLSGLGLAPGGRLQLGEASFRVERLITLEPDRGGGFVNLAPRAMIALERSATLDHDRRDAAGALAQLLDTHHFVAEVGVTASRELGLGGEHSGVERREFGAQLLLDGLCLLEERLTISLGRRQPLGPHHLGVP